MKTIALCFAVLYLCVLPLFTVNKGTPKNSDKTTVVEFTEQLIGDISEDINQEVPIDSFNDGNLLSGIERVCQKRNLTVEQTFYIYKIFYL